jgi:hypothetical protein
MSIPDSADIIAAAQLVVAERNELRALLGRVADAVLDKAPGGMSVAYLPADLLAEIRTRLI